MEEVNLEENINWFRENKFESTEGFYGTLKGDINMMNHIRPFLKIYRGQEISQQLYFTNEQEIFMSLFVLSSFCSQFSVTKPPLMLLNSICS